MAKAASLYVALAPLWGAVQFPKCYPVVSLRSTTGFYEVALVKGRGLDSARGCYFVLSSRSLVRSRTSSFRRLVFVLPRVRRGISFYPCRLPPGTSCSMRLLRAC